MPGNYDDLIGIPYVNGGRDLNGMDCYGLIYYLHEQDGHGELPDYESPNLASHKLATFIEALNSWEKVDLSPGATLLFRVPGNYHVGRYIGDDEFIHTWEGSGGVTIESLSTWKRRLIGAYKYAG